jgi:tight adherence protein B
MTMVQLFMLSGGAIMTLLILFLAFSGPATGKAQSRRLDVIKGRHTDTPALTVETQLRKIHGDRKKTGMDGVANSIIPNPALLRQRIERTGKSWTLGQYLTASLCIAFVIAAASIFKGAPILLGLLFGVALGFGIPYMVVGSLIGKRIEQFTSKFPDAIELMVRGLRSGLPISETLGVVGQELPGPIGVEFRGVTDRIRIGKSMDMALQEMADKLNTPEIQFFCITLAIQRETGGNLAETLSNLSDVLRKRAQMKLKIRAMSSESKASAYIIGALPFIVFALIYYISPNYMGEFFTEPRLIGLGIGGMCWMGIGAGVMAKMISFEI